MATGQDKHVSRRNRWVAGVAVAPFLLAGRAAEAQTSPNLQAQVDRLTALVQQLSQHDQALQAKVEALQAQLGPGTRLGQGGEPNPSARGTVATATPGVTSPSGVESNTGVPRSAKDAPADGGTALAAAPPVAAPRVLQSDAHLFTLSSADGQYTIGLVGVAQFDVGDYLAFTSRSHVVRPQQLSNGTNARRARIGFAGKAAGDFGYSFIYDAGNSQDTTQRGIETAQIVYNGFKGVVLEIGYSNLLHPGPVHQLQRPDV